MVEYQQRKIIENTFSESQIMAAASTVTLASPGNILLIGGGNVVSEVSGYKRLRNRSDDLDFVVNEDGLSGLSFIYQDTFTRVPDCSPQHADHHLYHLSVDGLRCAFFPDGIRGYSFTSSDFENAVVTSTSEGDIYSVPPEMNVALKIRRGASRTHVYGKDFVDFATILLGSVKREHPFDFALFQSYLRRGVCDACNLGENSFCLENISRYVTQVPSSDQDLLQIQYDSLSTAANQVCKK